MVETIFNETVASYTNINCDVFVVMPNHFHCILSILRADMESAPTVGDVIQSFKRNTTIKYISGVKTGIYPPFDKRIWQRNYHDHIIRTETNYENIWQYINTNPAKWADDRYYY